MPQGSSNALPSWITLHSFIVLLCKKKNTVVSEASNNFSHLPVEQSHTGEEVSISLRKKCSNYAVEANRRTRRYPRPTPTEYGRLWCHNRRKCRWCNHYKRGLASENFGRAGSLATSGSTTSVGQGSLAASCTPPDKLLGGYLPSNPNIGQTRTSDNTDFRCDIPDKLPRGLTAFKGFGLETKEEIHLKQCVFSEINH